MRDTAAQVYHLARRSIIRQSRQPANVVAPVIFPLGLLAVNAGGLQPHLNTTEREHGLSTPFLYNPPTAWLP